MTDSNLGLLVGGNLFSGWIDARCRYSLDELAGSFELTYYDRWGSADEAWRIMPGDECVLQDDGDTLVTGYVTDAGITLSADQYSFRVSGRSRTGDLAVASAQVSGGQLRGLTVGQIAAKVCEPFSIGVLDALGDSFKFPRFEIEEGETAHELIDRACRCRGIMPTTSPQGDLDLRRVGDVTRRVEAPPALQKQLVLSEAGRFSEYQFTSQTRSTDEHGGVKTIKVKASVTDPNISRYLPMRLHAEAGLSNLEARATWERNVRAGRAERLTWTCQGLRAPDGGLWELGMVVHVADTRLRVDADLIVASVDCSVSRSGSQTVLGLTRPEVYQLEELPLRGNAWR